MNALPPPQPRPGIAELVAYERTAARAGIDLFLDGNEGPLPAAASRLRRYPEDRPLRAALAHRFGCSDAEVAIGAGADELLDRACRAFLAPGRACVLPSPGFALLPHYVALAGGRLQPVPWLHGPFPLAHMLAATPIDAAMVVLTTPNNPTGATIAPWELQELARQRPRTLVVCDLAYVEFAAADPTPALLPLRNALVLRTFSKAYGLAGLRVGYALGDERVLACLRKAGSPYPVAAPSLELAFAALERGPDPRLLAQVRDERDQLTACLRARGHCVPDSAANFVLVVTPSITARDRLVAVLATAGIAVRTFPRPGELASAVRITCPGEPVAFARLLAALGRAGEPQA